DRGRASELGRRGRETGKDRSSTSRAHAAHADGRGIFSDPLGRARVERPFCVMANRRRHLGRNAPGDSSVRSHAPVPHTWARSQAAGVRRAGGAAAALTIHLLVTLLLPWLATQILIPSKAMPVGPVPTPKLP